MPYPGDEPVVWMCCSPECDETFLRYASQVGNPQRVYCSAKCRSRAVSLRKLSLDARAEIARRYEAGETITGLAAAYSTTQTTVRGVLKENDVPTCYARSIGTATARRHGLPPDEGNVHAGFRWCKDCRERKSMEEFYWVAGPAGKARTIRSRRCKPCHGRFARNTADLRANRRKYKYGLTVEEFKRLIADQGGCCAICKQSLDADSPSTHVDHCHFDGLVRGVLCPSCNTGLGLFRDDPDLLSAAMNYLLDGGHWHPNFDFSLEESA